MWARCQVREKSAELPARELCCQSCRTALALPGTPRAGLSASRPSPAFASLRIQDPPWDQEEEAGRRDVGILRCAHCVTLGWVLPTLGPGVPTCYKAGRAGHPGGSRVPTLSQGPRSPRQPQFQSGERTEG